MQKEKYDAICAIVDDCIKKFADSLTIKYKKQLKNPKGVINSKKNNCFIAELGKEFMFFSAFVRSFDSSFGGALETMGNSIAKLSYKVQGSINSFLLPAQSQHISSLMSSYDEHTTPLVTHYRDNNFIISKNTSSYEMNHQTDNYFYNETKKEHYIIELKAGGDLDIKKAKAEKIEMLKEYYLLKNLLADKPDHKIFIFFGTAYNKHGEGMPWKQERVKQYFAEDELLIGRNYWNFVCDDEQGFEIVFEQYKKSAHYIKDAIENIKKMYFEEIPNA